MNEVLWTPTAERRADSNLSRYLDRLKASGQAFDGDDELWRWSVDEPAAFWRSVWDFCGVAAESPPEAVLSDGDRMPGARWFEGARLNFSANLLQRVADPALIALDESGRRRAFSAGELRGAVASCAAALARDGVGAGDRVAGFLPNAAEAVVAMLAATRLGATWSSCSPDFGEQGVLDRFGQIAPKVLFACDGYRYNGKRIDTRDRVARIRAALPGLQRLVIVPFLDDDPDRPELPGATRFADYRADGAPEPLALPFDHPLYILYSSGTTGQPKCIVHGAGGTLVQHLKELVLHTDVRPGDRLFFFTTCGWMMWNWLVSGLAAGATVVLYDGAPTHPEPDALWRLAASERLTQMGVSPRYLSAVEKGGQRPGESHDLTCLRTLLSTGSPLAPEQFDYVYGAVKADLQLASISGGTDIISCFALGHPHRPVRRGELQTRGLGMAVEVFDDDGRPVRGAPGELVCTRPFPSMPVGFWADPDRSRYRAAYFERFAGAWHHGDYAELTTEGGLVISGRSDATLNPGGVRIGTAEIYRVVEALPEVTESVVVGLRRGGDEQVLLFVCLAAGVDWDEALDGRIRAALRAELTPRHVPAAIRPCPAVPRTISGKVTELAVRDLLHGCEVRNADALANPGALDYFRGLDPETLLT